MNYYNWKLFKNILIDILGTSVSSLLVKFHKIGLAVICVSQLFSNLYKLFTDTSKQGLFRGA